MGLTPKQLRFVDEYLIDSNATQAATRAGYSAKTANEQGARLLANASVAHAVNEAKKAQQKRTRITADRVLQSIDRLATRAEKARDWHAALKGQELLGKHLKLFVERVEVDIAEALTTRLAAARERILREKGKA